MKLGVRSSLRNVLALFLVLRVILVRMSYSKILECWILAFVRSFVHKNVILMSYFGPCISLGDYYRFF